MMRAIVLTITHSHLCILSLIVLWIVGLYEDRLPPVLRVVVDWLI